MIREFADTKGVQWKVWDVWPSERLSSAASSIATYPSHTLADGWLCFECADEKRRISPVPPGWEQWDADALCALCEKAGYVTATPRDSAAFRDAAGHTPPDAR